MYPKLKIPPAGAEDGDPLSRLSADAPLWTRPFVELVIAQALFGFGYSVFVLLPKLLATAYGAGVRDIGLVMASFGVASLLAIPAVAPVVKRVGRRRTLVAANALLGASALAFMAMTGAGPFAAFLRGVHGVASSLFFAAGMALVAECVPPTRLGQAIGLYGAANLVMTAIAPAVAEPVAAHFGARALFVLAAVTPLAGAWFCRRIGERAPDVAPPAASPAAAAPHGGRGLCVVLAVIAVGSLAASAIFTFIAPFALAHGVEVVRGFFIAYTATALGVRVFGARTTDRMGARRTVLVGSIAYGIIVVATGALGPAPLILFGALFGVAHGIVFPAMMALVIGGVAAADRPRRLALANGAINLGVTGVAALGTAAGQVGYRPVLIATGAFTIAMGALLRRRAPASPRPEAPASAS